MSSVFYVLISLCALCFVVVLFLWVWCYPIDYFVNRDKFSMKVSAKMLKDWYILNPNRYILKSNKVYVKSNMSDNDIDNCHSIELKNFIEYMKYQHFLTKLHKKSIEEITNRLNRNAILEHQKILNLVQSDIDKMRIKSEKELVSAAKSCKDIQYRLLEERFCKQREES